MDGNVSELGNVSEDPGKSSLFFLTTARVDPGIRLPGDRVTRLVKHLTSRGVRCILVGPGKSEGRILFAPLVVLITASGLQGE